ncbi:MAG: hypothetical protein A2X28_01870 [Elusimicrobia bacterium GWA2_56_46]|nr:MAG: hypothetical protein A2X28_01870 [Elusimicrobia bacterium GWA2_56_46]OGR55482.1 MAG: hypothetical protein A2X39_01095 [Elusimicrobia bacterium GWC2_56_31]HBW21950.1 hypothetical protein [Elusimicrobiota bacterium]
MKKALLFSPALQKDAQAHSKDNSYGLGLAYLHAVIEKAGYEIITKSFNNSDLAASEAEMVADLRSFRPDFLLVQIFTMNRVASYRLIKLARQVLPDVKIIIGGVHASIYYEQLLKNFEVDCAVIGEGEETVVELLGALASGLSAAGIRGAAYKENGAVVKNPDRPLIEDLDALPFPRHDLFIQPDREMACILTTRGCPFRCSFCCLHTISRRKFRKRSVKNVADEVEYILKTFKNINTIQLADDTFTLDQPRAIEFCKEVIRRNIKVKFLCSARIKPASVELFKLMEQAGFTGIGFGLETGSAKLLRSIHKNITREDVLETFRMLKDVDIKIVTYLMVGFPGENRDTLAETIDLINKLRQIKYFEFAGVARLWVYPNTEVYDIMKAAGRIDDNFWLTDQDVPFFTVEHSAEELDKMVTEITLGCTSLRQGIKRAAAELLHPRATAKKIIPRLRRLKKYFYR